MALSRLLQPKSSLRIDRYGFPKPVRWFSSQSSDVEVEKSSHLKKTSVPREKRAVAAESFVKRYVETNQGAFPKASHIQNEVGGSWHTVKAILHNIKEKMLGTPQLENHHTVDALAPMKDTASSAIMTSHSVCEDRIELNDYSKSVVHADQAQDKDGSIGHSISVASGESSSALMVGTAPSDVTDMPNSTGSCELQTLSNVQRTKYGLDFHTSESDASENFDVHLNRKYNSNCMVQLNAVMDNLQLQLDSQYTQPKGLFSNRSKTSDSCLVSSSDKLSHFEHDKLNSTGCGEQQENEIITCGAFPNSSVEMSQRSTLSNNLQKVSTLAGIFNKFTDDAAVAKDTNRNMESEASLSGILLRYENDRNSQAKSISPTDILRPSGSVNNWQDLRVGKSVSSGFENGRPGKDMIGSNLSQNLISNSAELFTGSRNFMGLGDDRSTNTKKDISVSTFFGHLEEPARKDEAKKSEIEGLIECIKGLPRGPSIARSQENISSSKTGESNQDSRLEIQSLASLQSFDKKERKMSVDGHAVLRKSKSDDLLKEMSVVSRTLGDNTGNPDCSKQKLHTHLAALTDKKELYGTGQKLCLMEEPGQNKAVVKFLPRNTHKSEIVEAFQPCGKVLEVEFLSHEQAFYRIANIYFKTREGLRKALERTDVLVKNVIVTVEAAAAGEDISNRTFIPSLIGDPDVPAGLVKYPTRTVKITQLTSDISSHDIVAALASFGSSITGFFLGALDSVAYVEFETEDGKEIALGKHYIDVMGKRLLISRVDAPRTTVVRILFHPSLKQTRINQVCSSLGKVRCVNSRQTGVIDVHFKLAEWPNMLKIINRLNAVEVDGHTLVAQPASVFPADILQILWSHPEERKYVKTVVQKLLKKLEENVVHKVKLTDLADFY